MLGDGTTEGILYDLGSYPGLVRAAPAVSGATLVPGELYEIREDEWERVIAQLDDYEGPEYERELIPVRTADGVVDAWAYLYRGSANGFATISAWPPK